MVTAGNQAQRYDKKMTYARDEMKKNADETDRRKKCRSSQPRARKGRKERA